MRTSDEVRKLVGELEQAAGPRVEFDNQIRFLTGWTLAQRAQSDDFRTWVTPAGSLTAWQENNRFDFYTESIDDALRLKPRGWGYKIQTDDWRVTHPGLEETVYASLHDLDHSVRARMELQSPSGDDAQNKRGIYAESFYSARAKTAPLALCAAAMRYLLIDIVKDELLVDILKGRVLPT